jgi:hypothetical protein
MGSSLGPLSSFVNGIFECPTKHLYPFTHLTGVFNCITNFGQRRRRAPPTHPSTASANASILKLACSSLCCRDPLACVVALNLGCSGHWQPWLPPRDSDIQSLTEKPRQLSLWLQRAARSGWSSERF